MWFFFHHYLYKLYQTLMQSIANFQRENGVYMINMEKMDYLDTMNALIDLVDTTMKILTLDLFSGHQTKYLENFLVLIRHLLIFSVTVSHFFSSVNFICGSNIIRSFLIERLRLWSTQWSPALTSTKQHIVNIIYEPIYGRVIDGWLFWSSSIIKWVFINILHVVQQRPWKQFDETNIHLHNICQREKAHDQKVRIVTHIPIISSIFQMLRFLSKKTCEILQHLFRLRFENKTYFCIGKYSRVILFCLTQLQGFREWTRDGVEIWERCAEIEDCEWCATSAFLLDENIYSFKQNTSYSL